jgi:hypothetical protein
MKISVASILAVLTALPGTGAEVPPSKIAAMRDVVTHDQIVEAARKAREENPMPVFKPVEGADPTVITRPQSLIARSEILSFQGKSTLVPKRAVIHIPKEMSDRLGMKDGYQIGSWLDFLNANRAWIRTVPVTRVQAEGREPMPEETIKSFEKEKRLVVATYQDGPISVMPLKVPPPVEPGVPGAPTAPGAPATPVPATTTASTAPTTTNVSKP